MAKTIAYPHVVRTPGTCGGRPRVDGHRLTVSDIVVWPDRLGLPPEEIATRYGLSLAQVHACLAYYFDHVEEIQAELTEAERIEARARQENPPLLKKRARG